MLDGLKLGQVYILESTVKCHHKKIVIDLFYLEVVYYIDAFNNYPCARRCFEDTVHVLTRSHSKPRWSLRTYDTYELPLAVQVNILIKIF